MKTLPQVPTATLQRLRTLHVQRQALDAQISAIVQTFLEAHDLEGEFEVDLRTGSVAPAIRPPVNGVPLSIVEGG